MKKFIKTLIERFAPIVREKIEEYAQEAIKQLRVHAENYNYAQQIDKAVEFIMGKCWACQQGGLTRHPGLFHQDSWHFTLYVMTV